MTAIIAACAVAFTVLSACAGYAQGEHLATNGRDEGYGLRCTYTFAYVAIAVMLIVVLAIL